MVDTNGIGILNFQVKTDVREIDIKETLDKICNEEFAEVSFTGSEKEKRNVATGYEVYENRG